MKTVKKQIVRQTNAVILTGNLVLALLWTGGYTQSSAAFLTILSGTALTVMIWKRGKTIISCDFNTITIAVFSLMYLLTSIWAVDSGMALEGFVHFLPVFLFYRLLCWNKDVKERIVNLLPLAGSLMTLFSFIMMFFSAFQDYVSVANRLSGFFQYPNTYAVFMLVCFIVSVYRLQEKNVDWLDYVHCVAAVFGIYMSGSRITFVLLVGVLFLLGARNKKIRKILIPFAAVLLIVVAVLGMLGITGDLFGRLFDISLHSSTLLGRLLYAQDAWKLILRYPFGCGYYGYYFLQTEIQTGVYSVANVHNELLQLMLDIGILPALLFYGMMIKNMFQKEVSERNRLVLLVLLFHSLLEYDFQFLAICFILLLFLKISEGKMYSISAFTKIVSGIGLFMVLFLSVCVGMSDFYLRNGQYEDAVKIYDGNTLAKVYLLTEQEDVNDMRTMAVSIMKNNQNVPLAYHALAQAELADGKVMKYLEYKEQALELAPYDINGYIDYVDALFYCFNLYNQNKDNESAQICLQKAKTIPEILNQIKERTSWLGWQIDDVPQLTLPIECMEQIEKMETEYDSIINERKG